MAALFFLLHDPGIGTPNVTATPFKSCAPMRRRASSQNALNAMTVGRCFQESRCVIRGLATGTTGYRFTDVTIFDTMTALLYITDSRITEIGS